MPHSVAAPHSVTMARVTVRQKPNDVESYKSR
jgi:hypothetical protein